MRGGVQSWHESLIKNNSFLICFDALGKWGMAWVVRAENGFWAAAREC
jgi:hypothetical protein